jgi:hypothetical protein
MIMMTTSSAFTKANISQQIALTFINAVIYWYDLRLRMATISHLNATSMIILLLLLYYY